MRFENLAWVAVRELWLAPPYHLQLLTVLPLRRWNPAETCILYCADDHHKVSKSTLFSAQNVATGSKTTSGMFTQGYKAKC